MKINHYDSGLVLIEPQIFTDPRGRFFEAYHLRKFDRAGIGVEFVQDNQSTSCPGTIRGLHYQVEPHVQAKLIRVLQGAILDVAVDIRPDSLGFGRVHCIELSAQDCCMLFVPKGFAHGFGVLGDEPAEVLYKCSRFYSPDHARGIRWNDLDLAINWHMSRDPIVSVQDGNNMSFAEYRESCKR